MYFSSVMLATLARTVIFGWISQAAKALSAYSYLGDRVIGVGRLADWTLLCHGG